MGNEKIKLEICCGTTCYMLGAAELLKIEDILPDNWRQFLDVSAIACMEACTAGNLGSAPFVRINGKLRANASVDSVLAELRPLIVERLGGEA